MYCQSLPPCARPHRAFAALLFLGLSALLSAPCTAAEPPPRSWPYTPLSRPAVPQVKQGDWVRNPVDAFVLARLEQQGLQPNPPADRLTLLRRVTFDLTGLAPTPAEREAFLADPSPDAYERLVDRLLASPHFGERWAQHWLDVVRYAETDGYKVDRRRPEAHRYRDYVVNAFNADLPYDVFIREQLAGDELEPDNPEALVATGLCRLHPEEANGSNYLEQRQDILNDITDVFGSAFLGLTLGCARCHDHKFDPLSQKDYYRVQAFFTPLIQRDDLLLGSAEARARYEKQLDVWNEATRGLRAEMAALVEPERKKIVDDSLVVFDPTTQQAMRAPASQRTPLQRQLVSLASKQVNRKCSRMARYLEPPKRARYEELEKKLAAFDNLKPQPLPTAMAVSDSGPEAPPTYRLATGSYLKPREEVQPGFPQVLDPTSPDIEPPAKSPSTGRRSALARWLTRPDHPLTGRVIVNRLWQHYLGQGIVGTPNDFGLMGEQATHPELLDYLATELVSQGWHLKAVHRLIVTSAAYRQSSAANLNPTAEQAAQVDPGNRLLWHARVKRREAEAIRDLVLQVSGQLNTRMFGPGAQPELPPAVQENPYAWEPDTQLQDRNRRSVYVFVKRNLAYPLFAVFDAPDRLNSCPVRAQTITAPQALAMFNGEFTQAQARTWSTRLLQAHGSDTAALIRDAYVSAFSREPEADELKAAEQFLRRQGQLSGAGENNPALTAAVTDFCHALLNAAEFLYVE